MSVKKTTKKKKSTKTSKVAAPATSDASESSKKDVTAGKKKPSFVKSKPTKLTTKSEGNAKLAAGAPPITPRVLKKANTLPPIRKTDILASPITASPTAEEDQSKKKRRSQPPPPANVKLVLDMESLQIVQQPLHGSCTVVEGSSVAGCITPPGTASSAKEQQQSPRAPIVMAAAAQSTTAVEKTLKGLPRRSQSSLGGMLISSVKSTSFTSPGSGKGAVEVSKPKPVRKFIVESNAYHCNVVQNALVSRGVEWKAVHREKKEITSAEITECAAVWFKYEHIKGPLPDDVRMHPSHVINLEVLKNPAVRKAYSVTVVPPSSIKAPAALQKSASPPSSPSSQPGESENGVTPTSERSLDESSSPVLSSSSAQAQQETACEETNQATRTPQQLLNAVARYVCNLKARQLDMRQYEAMPPRAAPPPRDSAQRNMHYQTMQTIPGATILSCFKDSQAVWRKHRLYMCFKKWCDADPEARGSVRERMPITFPYCLHTTTKEEAIAFMEAVNGQEGKKMWLAKATGGANGKGIFVNDDPAKVAAYIAEQATRGAPGCEGDWWVVQEFLTHIPLLKDRRRFQIKVHCFTLATPFGFDVYCHKGQRLQMCQEAYDIEKPISFVGNWAQQREKLQGAGAVAAASSHSDYMFAIGDIAKLYPQLTRCWNRMKQIIVDAVQAAYAEDLEHFDSNPGCFDIMGWDFVVEECQEEELEEDIRLPGGTGAEEQWRREKQWRPLLLEANHRPGFGSTRSYMENLILQCINLVAQPMYPDKRTKGTLPAKVAELEQHWDHCGTIIVHPQAEAINGYVPALPPLQEEVEEEAEEEQATSPRLQQPEE